MTDLHINLDDTEYTWPLGELPPATGPELIRMRQDSIEARLAGLERLMSVTSRQVALVAALLGVPAESASDA